MANERRLNRWVNAKGNRSYIFNNKHNKHSLFLFQQCRCDFNQDTKQVVFNYILDGWVNESTAQTQMRKWMRNNVTKGKLICTVDNLKFCNTSGDTSRVQVLWLNPTYKDPDEKIMTSLEERINQLPYTAPLKDEDMNKYYRQTYRDGENNVTCDNKNYIYNTEDIISAIERGEELDYISSLKSK